MPRRYVRKFFGKGRIRRDTPAGDKVTREFLAEELQVNPDEVALSGGRVLLSERAQEKLDELDPKDKSFVATGGFSRHTYEVMEMAYNDITSGALAACGERTLKKASKAPIMALLKNFLSKGGLQALRLGGLVGTAGIGIWLAGLGAKQIKQGRARQDTNQFWDGARSIFLGTESMAASLALGSRLTNNVFSRVAGMAAKAVAAPFALVHGVIDVAQGSCRVAKGAKEKDKIRMLEGAAEIGMGVGWLTAAWAATPVVVGLSCICLAAKIGFHSLGERKRAEEARVC